MTARCARPVVAIYSRITLLCYRVECHQLICIISAADVIIASLIRYGVADGSSARRCLTRCSFACYPLPHSSVCVCVLVCVLARKVCVQRHVIRNEPVIVYLPLIITPTPSPFRQSIPILSLSGLKVIHGDKRQFVEKQISTTECRRRDLTLELVLIIFSRGDLQSLVDDVSRRDER